jgi:hypothetical protein
VRSRRWIQRGAWLACVSACAGAPRPATSTPSDAPALAAIRRANASGANQDPDAVYELALANQEVQQAEVLIETGHDAEAAAMLSRAEADADTATRMVNAAHAGARPP